MALLSLNFIKILFLTLFIFYVVPQKYKWIILLFASYYFYLQSGIKYILYIFFTTISTYFIAKNIHYNNKLIINDETQDKTKALFQKKNQRLVIIAVVLNVGILLILKYINLFLRVFTSRETLDLILPLGISFYTLQSIGYVIDVHHKRVDASNNIFKYALFISYFPQIIQGPISEYDQLYPQFFSEKKFDYENIVMGFKLIIFGLFKKIVIADRAAVVVNEVFNNYLEYEGIMLFIGAAFYSIQIYGDFSGGIDIIRGISRMFDIQLPDNFKRPYFSKSITEFWQRWHITLGSWMKKYVFFPLALWKPMGRLSRKTRKRFGNHIGKQIPAALASLLVFILVGMWHGSSFKFIAYGLYNGIFVLSEPLLRNTYKKIKRNLRIKEDIFYSFFQMLRTTFLVIIGRFFSRGSRFLVSLNMIYRTFKYWNPWVLFDGSIYDILERKEMNVLVFALILLFCISYVQEKGISISNLLYQQSILVSWPITIAFILFILVFGYYGPNVKATDFIYGGF